MREFTDVPVRSWDNLLDLILTESPDRMLDVSVLPPLGTAKRAYALISWKFALKGEMVVTSRDRLDMRKGNFEKIRYELEKPDWGKLFLNKNANESYE